MGFERIDKPVRENYVSQQPPLDLRRARVPSAALFDDELHFWKSRKVPPAIESFGPGLITDLEFARDMLVGTVAVTREDLPASDLVIAQSFMEHWWPHSVTAVALSRMARELAGHGLTEAIMTSSNKNVVGFDHDPHHVDRSAIHIMPRILEQMGIKPPIQQTTWYDSEMVFVRASHPARPTPLLQRELPQFDPASYVSLAPRLKSPFWDR